jgi:hypothetical protein
MRYTRNSAATVDMDGDVEDGFQELLASSVTDGMFQDSLSGSEDFEAESHADKEPTSDVARRENAHVTATLGDCEQAYSSVLSRIALNPNKAGLSLVDKDHVNKIIYETSKDSKFFQNEIKKDRQVQERVVCLASVLTRHSVDSYHIRWFCCWRAGQDAGSACRSAPARGRRRPRDSFCRHARGG